MWGLMAQGVKCAGTPSFSVLHKLLYHFTASSRNVHGAQSEHYSIWVTVHLELDYWVLILIPNSSLWIRGCIIEWNEGYSYDVTHTLQYTMLKPYFWPTFFLTGFVNGWMSSSKNTFQHNQCWQIVTDWLKKKKIKSIFYFPSGNND